MNSSKLSKALAAAAIAANAFLPVTALAVDDTTVRESPSKRSDGFCEVLTQHQERLDSRIDTLEGKVDSARNDRKADRAVRMDAREQKLADIRARQVEKRSAQYEKLEGLADDDAEKEAVVTFRTAVEAAIADRRAAVDTANVAFKSGIDLAVADRKTKIDAWVSVFESSVKAALDKAQADCAAGVDAATIRATLKAAMDAARAALQDGRQAIDRTGETVKALAATHRAALEEAHADFKAAMEEARADLKDALDPDDDGDSSPDSDDEE